MIPGLPQDLLQGSDEEGSLRMKRMIYITDSMTAAELDSDGSMFMEWGKDGKPTGLTWRVTRVAKGSGTSVREVEDLLCQYRMMANMAKQAGGKHGWLQALQKMQAAAGGRGRGANGMPTPAQIQAMQVRRPQGARARRGRVLSVASFLPSFFSCDHSARCRRACCNSSSARCGAAAGCRR